MATIKPLPKTARNISKANSLFLFIDYHLLNLGIFGVILGPPPRPGNILDALSVIGGVGLDIPMGMSPVVSPFGSGSKPMPTLRSPFGSIKKSIKPISPVTLRDGALPYRSFIVW